VGWDHAAPRDALPLARESAERALAIDDSIGMPHGVLAYCKQVLDWDWERAGELHHRALELDPTDAMIRQAYCLFLIPTGRIEVAIDEASLGAELDPLSGASTHFLGIVLAQSGHWEEARLAHEKALELDPSRGWTLITLGICKLRSGARDRDDALTDIRQGVDLVRRHAPVLSTAAVGYAMAGEASEARAILQELKRRSESEWVSPYKLARIHAALGDTDTAFEWFNRALDERDGQVYWIHYDYATESLRADPRFHDILERMGLSSYAP
jgi:Tfp pilus assembly protein PilF